MGEILGDLTNLIYYTLVYKLNILPIHFNRYNCVLIVPDIFHRTQVKSLVSMIFKEF